MWIMAKYFNDDYLLEFINNITSPLSVCLQCSVIYMQLNSVTVNAGPQAYTK